MSREGRSIYATRHSQRVVGELYASMLARWPVPFDSVSVATRHGPTSAIASGVRGAPPLVLLHGAGSSAVMWMGDVARLAERHRVFAVDIIGEPGRSAPVRLPWKGRGYADWLSDVLDGLGLEQTRLIGLSQGGWIALDFAIAYAERVDKLVLLSPAGVTRDRLTFVLRAIPLLLLGQRGKRIISRIVAGGQPLDPEALAFVDAMMAHVRPRTDPAPLFSDDELARLSMPVLLVGGDKDAIRDCRAIAARLHEHLPRLRAEILPGMGHVLVDLAALIAPFLEGPPGEARAAGS
jgi:pimeloyl-ACP methyl ester carboxylesterase